MHLWTSSRLRVPGSIFIAVLLCSRLVVAVEAPKLVAVLPLADMGGTVDRLARDSVEETIRTVGGDLLTPHGFLVLTGENTLKILSDNGVDSAKACETECALAAARELKASLFISGSASRLEGQVIVFVRLYDAKTGGQLASLKLESETVRGVRAAFEEKAPAFFGKLWTTDSVASSPVAPDSPPAAAVPAPPSAGTWRVTFVSPNAREPWTLVDAKLNPVCGTLPCTLEVPAQLDFRLRRGAARPSEIVDLTLTDNLDGLGLTRGLALHTELVKDWGRAAAVGYGMVGGSILGVSAVIGLIAAVTAGWRPTDWWDRDGNFFWGTAGVGAGVAAVVGTIVLLAYNPQRVVIEAGSLP